MDDSPEDLSRFGKDHCFKEPGYDIIHYYDAQRIEREKLNIEVAREARHIIPEGYVPLPPQPDGSPNERAGDHLEEAQDAIFMKRAAVMVADAAPQIELNHNLF